MSFDEYAKTWDTEQRITRANIIAKEISRSIGNRKKGSAMEFGCGTGLISFALLDEFKDITMIDSSKGMIDILNSKIDDYHVTNMTAMQLDILMEDTSDMHFDVIYSSMVLHHICDTAAIIRKFYELLNEDGYLCIVDLDAEDGRFHKNETDFNGHNGFEQEDLKDLLINTGLKEVESTTFYYDNKIIDDEKVSYSLFIMKARK